MAAPQSNAPFRHLVIDANAIIAGAQLKGLAQQYWTVAEAVAEIRDSRARQAMQLLPFKLETRVPSDESIAAVRDFAAKTGDARTLSRTDVLLLALTHQLEKQENGSTYIRAQPPAHETRAAKTGDFSGAATRPGQQPECRFFKAPGGCRSGDACRFRHVTDDAAAVAAGEGNDGAAIAAAPATSSAAAGGSASGAAATGSDDSAAGQVAAGGSSSAAPSSSSLPSFPAGEDDEGEWIGPTGDGPMFDSVFPADIPGLGPAGGGAAGGAGQTAADAGGAAGGAAAADPTAAVSAPGQARRVPVACITTDFAMQNTLLQQGLLLATHSGKVVTSVKQWVLKCDACFTIFPAGALTSAPDALFCKRCGNATLARLGVTLGADGTPRYHYKKNRQVNTRGTVYAIPKPQGGRLQDGSSAVKQELLLRGDQLLMGSWKERARQEAAPERSSLLADRTIDDRMLEALGTGAGRAAARAGFGGGWLGPTSTGFTGDMPIQPGWGRKNPNSNRVHKNHRK